MIEAMVAAVELCRTGWRRPGTAPGTMPKVVLRGNGTKVVKPPRERPIFWAAREEAGLNTLHGLRAASWCAHDRRVDVVVVATPFW